jgi:hypothetical protein
MAVKLARGSCDQPRVCPRGNGKVGLPATGTDGGSEAGEQETAMPGVEKAAVASSFELDGSAELIYN